MSRPADGDGAGDEPVPRVRACGPGPQPVHRAGATPRAPARQDQGHHVADPLRRGLPPQPQNSSQVRFEKR